MSWSIWTSGRRGSQWFLSQCCVDGRRLNAYFPGQFYLSIMAPSWAAFFIYHSAYDEKRKESCFSNEVIQENASLKMLLIVWNFPGYWRVINSEDPSWFWGFFSWFSVPKYMFCWDYLNKKTHLTKKFTQIRPRNLPVSVSLQALLETCHVWGKNKVLI